MQATRQTRVTAALLALAMSTLVLGGTAVAMTSEAGHTPQQLLVLERTVITSAAVN